MAGRRASVNVTRYPGLQVSTSSAGLQIPIVWGTGRVRSNLLWYGGFKATPVKSATGGGGGKGGGGTQVTSYNYSASFILGICEGPIDGISAVYVDSAIYTNGPSAADPSGVGTALSQAGLALATGAIGQAVWPYLTSNFPAQAIGYSGVAYAYTSNHALDSGASTPNYSFEVQRLTGFQVGSTPNADPSLIVSDFFTNTRTGVPGWGSGLLDAVSLTSAANSFQNYCLAAGLILSPVIDSARSATDFLNELFLATNSTCVWSEGVLKFIPYGDTTLSGNGKTYTPNTTPVYVLNDDDYIVDKDQDPIQVDIKDQSDAYNVVQLEYLDRTNSYNMGIALASDEANVTQFGMRRKDPDTVHCICDQAIAQNAAQLYLQRTLYVRAQYKFGLDWRFGLLEPGDLLELNDAGLGLMNYPVRIVQIDEDADSADGKPTYQLICEDYLGGVANAPLYTAQNALGIGPGINLDPGAPEANLLIQSGDVSNAAWTTSGCTITGSAHTDQYGLTTAGVLVPTTPAPTVTQLGTATFNTAGAIGTPQPIFSASNANVASGAQLTTANDAPAGSLIVVYVSGYSGLNATITGVTDSAGNTYTQAEQNTTTAGFYNSGFWFCSNCTHLPAGGWIAATRASGTMEVMAWTVSGANGGVDQAANTLTTSTAASSVSTSTLAQAAEIAFAAPAQTAAITSFVEGAGFNTLQAPTGSNNNVAYKITAATTALTYSASWSWSGGSGNTTNIIATFKGSSASATTLAITTTADAPAGHCIGVLVGAESGTITGVTDSAGNTYVAGTSFTTSSSQRVTPYFCQNPVHLPLGGTITATFGTGATQKYMSAISIANVLTSSAIDVQGAGTTGTGTAPSIATGTLAQASEIVLGFDIVAAGASDTYTEASGFTANAAAGVSGASEIHWAYKVVNATTTVTFAPTLGTSRAYAANVISLKGSGTNAQHYVAQSITSFAGINYIGAVCIQKNAHKNARVTISDITGANGAYIEVDANAGTILTPATALGSGVVVSGHMLTTLVAGIWQVVLCVNVPAVTTLRLKINALDDSGALAWAADGSNALNISQAQIRQGVAIGVYAPTAAVAAGPLIFNPPVVMTAGQLEAWAAVAGGPNWGGFNLWTSIDGVNYQFEGTVTGGARYGGLTASYASHADPDTADTLSVDISASAGALTSASSATADAGGSICMVGAELVCFSTATLTNPGRYDLSAYIRRGYLNTAIAAHAIADNFVRLDGQPVELPYFPTAAGKTVFAKFQSFNLYGRGTVDLANCIAYPFTATPAGAAAPSSSFWTAIATTLSNAGQSIPAIEITGSSDNPSASGIDFLYRVTGTSIWASAGIGSNATTKKDITTVMSGQSYDVAIAYVVGGLLSAIQVIATGLAVGTIVTGGSGSIVGTTLLNDSVAGVGKTFTVPSGSYGHVDIILTGIGGNGLLTNTGSGKDFNFVYLGGGAGGTAVTLSFAVTPGTTVFTYTIPAAIGNDATCAATGLTTMTAHSGTSASGASQGVGGTSSGGATHNFTGHNGGLTDSWDGGGAANASGTYVDQTTNGTAGIAPGGGGAGGTTGGNSPGAGASLQIIART